ncbi:MAG: hypothetical protein RLY64_1088 [Bacteroidota bacterium]
MRFILFTLLLGSTLASFSQSKGIIRGIITNAKNNEAVGFATVSIQGTTIGVNSTEDGKYQIPNLNPGFYTVKVTFVGFRTKTISDIQVYNSRPTILNIELEENVLDGKGVDIKANAFERKEESPLSLRSIGVAEIQRNPGGNRDISKAIQSLPGVASGVAFRNDIIIRGGAPNENRFYLDGVEVPNINHFATQGASGGPVGLINVDLIREVDFYSGAFPANRGNTLSSVLEFKQKEARDDKNAFRFAMGSSDFGLLSEGPLGKNKRASYLLSARRSYLQFLFSALGLPFLPTYNDFQTKVKYKFKNNSELYFVGLGAVDQFNLNLEANETEDQRYILGYLPVNTQWNYTNGLVYKKYRKNGYQTFVLSRNMLNNRIYKFENNDESKAKITDYLSQESENKFRYENNITSNGFKINYGVGLERVRYYNKTFQQRSFGGQVSTINFEGELKFNKYAAFGQVSRYVLNSRLLLSAGFRMDGNDYSESMKKIWQQPSPRFSLSYALTDRINFNANTGIYYQLPSYTILGYRDRLGNLVNQQNDVKFLKNHHYVAGFDYTTSKNFKASVEGFYKKYSQYPFDLNDSICLANVGTDFGVIGNTPVSSIAFGRTYGLEFLLQQRMYKGFYGIMAFTLVRSEFSERNNEYKPSAWDNRYLLTITTGKTFKNNWEAGIRFRYIGGTPFTPYDTLASSLVQVWDATGQGVLDYSRLNSLRSPNTLQLDFRIDKKFNFDKYSLNLYFDIQNATNYQVAGQPFLNVATDANGNKIIANPGSSEPRYQLKEIQNTAGTLLPALGIIFDF